jgi:hypothetical protein
MGYVTLNVLSLRRTGLRYTTFSGPHEYEGL